MAKLHHKLILSCAAIGAAVTAGAYVFFGSPLLILIAASVGTFGGGCALGLCN